MNCLAELDRFDAARFLTDYWSRQPCLIRGWLQPEARDLDDMLTLAAAEDLPTRLISGSLAGDEWRVLHGIQRPDELPSEARDWTVLVQEMDKACPQVASILDAFDFLPHWLLDDVMISEAVPGGSVGPHQDAYDVFLVQVKGHRRWELARRDDFEADARFELALIGNWTAEVSIETGPGDVLYLPPGVGHHGVATDRCQTWSVGLRTPSGPELMFPLAERLLDEEAAGARLRVTDIDERYPDRIDAALIRQARQLLEQGLALDDRDLGRLLATFLTRWRLWPGDESVELAAITRQLRAGHAVYLAATARLALLGEDQLYVNGEPIDCPPELALDLSRRRRLHGDWLAHENALDQLLELGAIQRPLGPSVVR
jgi:50S ribosomal protein L16 3-hydroxylase